MGQKEQDSLIADALRARTEATRNLKMLNDHLRNLGIKIKQIGEYLAPFDGKEPQWDAVNSNLDTSALRAAAEVIDIDKLRLLIAERVELGRVVEEKSNALRGYGAE